MNRRIALGLIGAVAAAALLAFGSAATSQAQTLTAQQQLAFDIYKELVEINTVTATGDTGRAADAMAARLRAALIACLKDCQLQSESSCRVLSLPYSFRCARIGGIYQENERWIGIGFPETGSRSRAR